MCVLLLLLLLLCVCIYVYVYLCVCVCMCVCVCVCVCFAGPVRSLKTLARKSSINWDVVLSESSCLL